MGGRTFVALDLETTGLDPGRDTVIEVGAVRFQEDQILERFVTFVNPRRAIPLRIQQITGIRDADVASAPTFDEIAPELLAFVGSNVSAIVAHNAQFDLGFLRAQGVVFSCPALDTRELATIVLPGLASYSLSELCNHTNVPLVGAHRALADTEATAALFHCLNQRFAQLSDDVLEAIISSAGDNNWPPLLLISDALRSRHPAGRLIWPTAFSNPSTAAPPAATAGRLSGTLPPAGQSPAAPQYPPLPRQRPPQSLLADEAATITQIQAEEVASLFDAGGALAQSYGAAYEPRPGQIDMACQVAKIFNAGGHLLIEAGTGTGKSMAYLLPAARWAVANQRRVLIATHTLALQEQLLERDVPRVSEILRCMGQTLHAAVLKGRSNYLCRRRLHQWRTSKRLSASELSTLARILAWLPATQTGDLGELSLTTPTDREIWQQVCSDAATCSHERCGSHAPVEQQDFFLLARRQAEEAHILIVNHALLLADAVSEGKVLPPFSHLVVDEAHQLDGAATDHLTWRMEIPWITALVRRLARNGDVYRQMDQVLWFSGVTETQEIVGRMASLAVDAIASLQLVSEHLLAFALHMEQENDTGYTQRLPLDGQVRSQPGWGEVELAWEQSANLLQQLAECASALAQALSATQSAQDESTSIPQPQAPPNLQPQALATLLADLIGINAGLTDLLRRSRRIVHAPGGVQNTGTVCWIEINDGRPQVVPAKNGMGATSVMLAEAPLHVGDLIHRSLVQQRRATIFTGATLRSGASFRYLRERLGLWDLPAAIVESPFDYRQAALIFMPSDLVQPSHAAWQSSVERAIIDAAEACNGRTLALFTSNGHLRASAEAIRGPLDRLGIPVLQQGAGSRQRILREFREQPRALLMGTRTYWEGMDFPGDELNCLIIVKLPFAVPNDPLVAARSSEHEDAFNDYMLPDAVLRFRQGFGRLIRRAGDRGVVVLLDSRIWRKEYGQLFLDALPPCTVRHAPLSVLAGEMRKWLQR